jgi:subtilase family serine protease
MNSRHLSSFSFRTIKLAVKRSNGAPGVCATLRALRCGAALIAFAAIAMIEPLAVANAQMVTLAQNHPAAGASLTGRAAADQTLNLTVALTLRDQAKLDKLLANQQDPKSAQFHQWLTPAQFSQRFGRTQQEVNAISNWLTANGFHVTAASGRQITAVGNAAIAEAAFHTTIATTPDGSVFANLSDPEIPTNLNGLIGSIDGLDNTRHAVPLAHQVSAAPALASALALDGTTGNGVEPDYTGNLGTAFGPGDFYTFYDESPLLNTSINGGGNDCVAFIEDSDFLASAVTLFDTTFSLSTASVTKIFPDTSNPGTNGDEIEVLLDIEWGHAVAPGAAIRVYEASSLSDAINGAVQDNVCGVISISYAYCGSSVAFFSGTLDPMFSQAASQGQSVFISAGDEGSAGLTASCGVGTTQNVNEMSADTHITAGFRLGDRERVERSGGSYGRRQECRLRQAIVSNRQHSGGRQARRPRRCLWLESLLSRLLLGYG